MGNAPSAQNRENIIRAPIPITRDDAKYCDPCQKQRKILTDPLYWCEDCENQLCYQCENHHQMAPATIKHTVTKIVRKADTNSNTQFQVSGRRSDFQVNGRRANNNGSTAVDTKSGGQVSGRHSEREVSGRRAKNADPIVVGANSKGEVSGRRLNTKQSKGSTSKGQVSGKHGQLTESDEALGSEAIGQIETSDKPYKYVSFIQGLNMTTSNDTGPCEVYGFVPTKDMLIVGDMRNRKLKVFDSTYVFKYEHQLRTQPYNVDMLDESTVVVASPEGTHLKLLTVKEDHMMELLEINVGKEVYGVCCYNGLIYCLVAERLERIVQSHVCVYIRDGTLQRRFQYLTYGKTEYKSMYYITADAKTGILYLTDCEKHAIITLTTDGEVTAAMSTKKLRFPLGISVDKFGKIYVSGMGSNNVVQMSADGKDIKEILCKDIRCKNAQCVRVYGNKLYLTRPGSDVMSIYELSCTDSGVVDRTRVKDNAVTICL